MITPGTPFDVPASMKVLGGGWPGIYDRGTNHPDWEFFCHVNMTDPFYHKRAKDFLAAPYFWRTEQKIQLICLITARYKTVDWLSWNDYTTLQNLGRTLLEGTEGCLKSLNNSPKDMKSYLDGLLEVIRLIHVDWIQ